MPPTARASTLYQPNVKVVRLALLRIREVPSSNLSMKIGSPDGWSYLFLFIPQSLGAVDGSVSHTMWFEIFLAMNVPGYDAV